MDRDALRQAASQTWILEGPNSGGQAGYARVGELLYPFHDDFGGSWVGTPETIADFLERHADSDHRRTRAMCEALAQTR